MATLEPGQAALFIGPAPDCKVEHSPHRNSLCVILAIEADGDRITDLHVWQVGPGHHAAIVSIVTAQPRPLKTYRAKLAHIHDLSHLTVEVDALESVEAASRDFAGFEVTSRC